jgi:hypothetical protein
VVRPARWRLAVAVAALGLETVVTAEGPQWAARFGVAATPVAIGLAGAAFAVGAWCVLRLPAKTAVPLVLLGAVLITLAASGGPPRSSDDLYRYLWDGRVQAAGIDPYRYPPAAPELAGLRDPYLWPASSGYCIDQSTVDFTKGCTLINRPTVPTIYPPVAEAVFYAAHVLSPPDARYWPMRVLAIVAALATTLILLWHSGRRAVLWAWAPTVAIEAVSNAHIDVVAALLTVVALVLLSRRRAVWGGIALGLAVATKVTPVLAVPAALRRRPVSVGLALLGAVVTVYLPHVLAVGAAVLGYLPGYLRDEGYDNGTRFALLSLVVPRAWAGPAAVVVLAAAGLWVLRRGDPDRPWLGATTMAGVALLVTTPSYPWYALLLVLLVALGGPARWLAVAAAGYVGQYYDTLHLELVTANRIGYLAALAVVIVPWLWHRRTTPWDTAAEPGRRPDTVEA